MYPWNLVRRKMTVFFLWNNILEGIKHMHNQLKEYSEQAKLNFIVKEEKLYNFRCGSSFHKRFKNNLMEELAQCPAYP